MNISNIKKVIPAFFALAIAVTSSFVSAQEAQAQDLIARQAPIDRKMKAVDSVAISRVVKKQKEVSAFQESELYTSWNTDVVHCYSNVETPANYRVDLRGFHMPTPSRVVTSNYGYRPSFGRNHKGIDVKVYIGDTIVSAFDGKVRIVKYEAIGYGNYIVIRHGNGLETIYGHLSKQLVKVGDVVKAGQPIGLGGNTGRSNGSHLHFETRILGEAINPALMFDFVHQDVTGDFYEYKRSGASKSARLPNAEPAPAAVAVEKAEVPKEIAAAPAQPTAKSRKEEQKAREKARKEKEKREKEKKQKATYTVKAGDTLTSIAAKKGCSVKELCSRNGIKADATLSIGQKIK